MGNYEFIASLFACFSALYVYTLAAHRINQREYGFFMSWMIVIVVVSVTILIVNIVVLVILFNQQYVFSKTVGGLYWLAQTIVVIFLSKFIERKSAL